MRREGERPSIGCFLDEANLAEDYDNDGLESGFDREDEEGEYQRIEPQPTHWHPIPPFCRYSEGEKSQQPDLSSEFERQNGAALIDHGTPRANDACDAYGKGDTTAFYGAAKSLAAKDAAETQGRSTQPPWVRGVVYPSNPETEEQAIQRAEALEGGEL